MEIELILFLSIHALAQPYERRWHNIIDSLVFTNLAAINGLTLHNYVRASSPSSMSYKHAIDIVSSIQLVLIYLPLVYMIGYVTCSLLSGMRGLLLTRKHKNDPSKLQDDIELPARLIHSDSSDSEKEDLEYHQFHSARY